MPEGNTFRKAAPGEPLEIPADAYNAFVEAALDHRAGRRAARPGKGAGGADGHNLVRVKNGHSATVTRFSCLKIATAIVVDPDDGDESLSEFIEQRPLEGVAPSTSADTFCLVLEPLAQNDVGAGLVAGVTAAQVEMADSGHAYANPDPADVARLLSAATGQVKILWKRGGSGLVWAVVQLLGQAPAAAASGASAVIRPGSTVSSGNRFSGYKNTYVRSTNAWTEDAGVTVYVSDPNGRTLNEDTRYLCNYMGTESGTEVYIAQRHLGVKATGFATVTPGVDTLQFDEPSGLDANVIDDYTVEVTLHSATPTQKGAVSTAGGQVFGGTKRFADGLTATPSLALSSDVVEVPDTTNGPLGDLGLGIKLLGDAGVYRLTPGNANLVLAVNQSGSRTHLILVGNSLTLDTPANDGRIIIDGNTGQTGTVNGLTFKGGIWVSGSGSGGGMTGTIG